MWRGGLQCQFGCGWIVRRDVKRRWPLKWRAHCTSPASLISEEIRQRDKPDTDGNQQRRARDKIWKYHEDEAANERHDRPLSFAIDEEAKAD
jgi:hypothetical protein